MINAPPILYLPGKDNVIVVIDDLELSTGEVYERITRDQPDIMKHSARLFLFSEDDKKCLQDGKPPPELQTRLKGLKTACENAKYLKRIKKNKENSK
ncbi:hypothetical protein GDO81_020635 [Engystomops pustulosus]|uniref:Uncharacterized protein n=1 Tax=Engystomops pustulosus TaxID=76066 RepID=A0AAV6ZBQ7_ENGPU|nr:hypothetical protein GDO81_020635 [Engystomops pustulosus]